MKNLLIPALAGLLLLTGCSYRYYAEALKPLSEAEQGEGKTVADDGTVTHTQGRLEISLRPMTDEELNRQFASFSRDGADSRNPYTFGNSTWFRTGDTPQRFTVFRAFVSNYQYPKVYVDPESIYITTSNGRKYYALNREQLSFYYQRYVGGGHGGNAPGMGGNAYSTWVERDAILRGTMLPDQPVFSAQEKGGFLVFKPLAPDVEVLTVHIPGVVVRFDYKGDPVEEVDVAMRFEREIGRVYPDGTRVATGE